MKLIFTLIGILNIGFASYSQENTLELDTLSSNKKWEFNVDLASRYIWRGQSWGGDYFVVQPTVNYAISDKVKVGIWATSNFKKEYFYNDGITSYKGYQEIDFTITYQINSFLAFQVWDYYWPSVKKVEGIDNGFFNYKSNGVKTIDATLLFDFSAFKLPLNAMLSTLVAGNDYRYDASGDNPKQNFTTYFEVGYSLEEVFQKVTLDPIVGVVFNNQAQYYSAGDYDKPSLVHLGLKASRTFDLAKGFTMPLSLNYIHNAATKNTETFGRNFLVLGVTFNYQ